MTTFFVKINWLWFFGDNVLENKRFALDKKCALKPVSFIIINEQWSTSSPWFKNVLSSPQCCSNESVWKIFDSISVYVVTCLFCIPGMLNIQILFPMFSCIISPIIFNWCYIYFMCGIYKIIRSGAIVKITIYKKIKVEHWCAVVDLRLTFFNYLLSKFDINFVPSISI